MAAFNNLKNILMLAFDWILYSGGVADTCQVTVTQPRSQEADSSMHTVFLTCAFFASGCSSSPPQILWFRFFTNKHEDLCTPGCRDQQKYKVHFSSKNNVSLQINNLSVYDNAVYICGVAFSDSSSLRSKQTGGGTVLTKKGAEEQHSNGKLTFTFMIIISSSLFLYSTTVFTFFVVYKLKPKLLKKSGKEDSGTEDCKIRSGRKIFQAIAQELRKQRMMWKMTLMTLFIRTDEHVQQLICSMFLMPPKGHMKTSLFVTGFLTLKSEGETLQDSVHHEYFLNKSPKPSTLYITSMLYILAV